MAFTALEGAELKQLSRGFAEMDLLPFLDLPSDSQSQGKTQPLAPQWKANFKANYKLLFMAPHSALLHCFFFFSNKALLYSIYSDN